MSEEQKLVDEESLKATLPVVWQILKAILFASIMILQELMARVAGGPQLSGPDRECIISFLQAISAYWAF